MFAASACWGFVCSSASGRCFIRPAEKTQNSPAYQSWFYSFEKGQAVFRLVPAWPLRLPNLYWVDGDGPANDVKSSDEHSYLPLWTLTDRDHHQVVGRLSPSSCWNAWHSGAQPTPTTNLLVSNQSHQTPMTTLSDMGVFHSNLPQQDKLACTDGMGRCQNWAWTCSLASWKLEALPQGCKFICITGCGEVFVKFKNSRYERGVAKWAKSLFGESVNNVVPANGLGAAREAQGFLCTKPSRAPYTH